MAKKALCIGIYNYPGTQMDLQGCDNDAQDWAAALAARDFKVATLLDDSCHSGTVTRAAKAEKDADTRPRFMPMGNWLPEKMLPKNRAGKVAATMTGASGTSPMLAAYANKLGDLLLSGGKEGPNNFSYDARINGRFNGAFTYYALKALTALKPGATYADWSKSIGKYLPSASYPQSPQILGSQGTRQGRVFE